MIQRLRPAFASRDSALVSVQDAAQRAAQAEAQQAVQAAARRAAQQRIPRLAGLLTMRVVVGLKVRHCSEAGQSAAEAVVRETMQDLRGSTQRIVRKAACTALLQVSPCLPAQERSRLESLVQTTAEAETRMALETAGRLSLDLLTEAGEGPSAPQPLWARTAASLWIRWLTACQQAIPIPAETLLRWLLPEQDRDCLLADLQEELESEILPRAGLREARHWYWHQTLRSVGPLGRARLAAWMAWFKGHLDT